jgi:hypothetical protein
MKKSQESKNNLGTAGEYRVLSELLLRGYNAAITMGNSKGTDILVFNSERKFLRVEVKTCGNRKKFVTSYFPKYTTVGHTNPDLWVLYQPYLFNESGNDTFFVLTHQEVRELQLKQNNGNETKAGEGVDNISLRLLITENIEPNNWEKISELFV